MGNMISGEERPLGAPRQRTKSPNGIIWIDDQCGYRHPNNLTEKQNRRKSGHEKNGEEGKRPRSHSLDAIIEELCFSASEDANSANFQGRLDQTYKNSYIPRVKLTRNCSKKENQKSGASSEMSRRPQVLQIIDSATTSKNAQEKKENNCSTKSCPESHEPDYYDFPEKHDENYFTKNFDECMKRLKLIEKEHEMMEKDEKKIQFYSLRKPNKRPRTPLENNRQQQKSEENQKDSRSKSLSHIYSEKPEKSESATTLESDGKSCNGRYDDSKKQFEKSEEEEAKAPCRITGATLKISSSSPKSSEEKSPETRHYFSRLVRSNKSLIDEELPDPDKVKNIRAMFQQSLNSTLMMQLNRFGGSLQNISTKTREKDNLVRPMSAQGNRPKETNDALKEQTKTVDERRFVRKAEWEKTNSNGRWKKQCQRKWTDTGSVSSGVSSDFSSCETDADVESCSREGIESYEANVTDEEVKHQVDDKHYVRNEILEKIRSFGTSVTYFGGQMITCSVGPLVSPTTHAIMEEIGEKFLNRSNGTRTFDEFYRKYIETNEINRKKKLGRTRSFGQNDVFQKPNVLNDSEIELYKNDLEAEFGIRKPSGKSQNSMKMKLVKSNSVGSRLELSGREEVAKKLEEILETAVERAINERNSVGQKIPDKCNEILFGYEKNLVNAEKKTDMEFESFQVCETVSEKLEKMQENSPDYTITIHINQQEPTETATTETSKEKLEEIIINDQDPLDSLEIYLKNSRSNQEKEPEIAPKRKWNVNLNEETETEGKDEEKAIVVIVNQVPQKEEEKTEEDEEGEEGQKVSSKKSKWPIETTVMVDIQKSEQKTPKIVANGKSVKTKIRLF